MRSLVAVSVLCALAAVACGGNSSSSSADSAGAAATQGTADVLGKLLVGKWEGMSFPGRKEIEFLTVAKDGTYTATFLEGFAPEGNSAGKERGTWKAVKGATSSTGSVTLAPESGDARVYAAEILPGEMQLSVGSDVSELSETQAFFRDTSTGSDDPTEPVGDGLDVACKVRKGGALITIRVADVEDFTFWSRKSAFIDMAESLLDSGQSMIPMFEAPTQGKDCDGKFAITIDPDQMEWAQLARETCDAIPSHVGHENFASGPVHQWCPWITHVTKVERR